MIPFIIILSILNKLSVESSFSYITKIERVAGLPLGVFFWKPIIEYGVKWGGLIEDFYVSVDCAVPEKEIYIELGANCFRVGPFYMVDVRGVELIPNGGFLRIDIAGLATGAFAGEKFADVIDEERNGMFLGLKLRYVVLDRLPLTLFVSRGVVREGTFLEYGAGVSFTPFKRMEKWNLIRELAFTAGISIAHLGYVKDKEPYTLTFGYYLVGVRYEFPLPKPPEEHE